MIVVDKHEGETPLQALERVRVEQGIGADVPMTYAGRLDPMASGLMIVLVRDECKNKEQYLGLDKEYLVEVVFGFETDTYDPLGLVVRVGSSESMESVRNILADQAQVKELLAKYAGKFEQEYPIYSSKTVDGKQLHEYAREGDIPTHMPTKEVEIFGIECEGVRSVSGGDIVKGILDRVSKVDGDFRQAEILKKWQKVGEDVAGLEFPIIKLRIACSSGTYMRSLAYRMGHNVGTGALALMIRRTRVGDEYLSR